MPGNIPVNPDQVYRHVGWIGWEDWLGTGKEIDPEPSLSVSTEIMIDCKCRGRIENCPECDGKGYYSVHLH